MFHAFIGKYIIEDELKIITNSKKRIMTDKDKKPYIKRNPLNIDLCLFFLKTLNTVL